MLHIIILTVWHYLCELYSLIPCVYVYGLTTAIFDYIRVILLSRLFWKLYNMTIYIPTSILTATPTDPKTNRYLRNNHNADSKHRGYKTNNRSQRVVRHLAQLPCYTWSSVTSEVVGGRKGEEKRGKRRGGGCGNTKTPKNTSKAIYISAKQQKQHILYNYKITSLYT